MPGRHNTVYDLTNLLLHPDGTRVRRGPSNRNSRSAVQGSSRSRWFARDAVGPSETRKFQWTSTNASNGPEDDREAEFTEQDFAHIDAQDASDFEEDDQPVGSSSKKRKATGQSQRTVKRREFFDDDSYLDYERKSSHITMHKDGSRALSRPDSDLLKYIHYHASTFYERRGCLRNSSRTHKKETEARQTVASDAVDTGASSAVGYDDDRLEGTSSRTLDAPSTLPTPIEDAPEDTYSGDDDRREKIDDLEVDRKGKGKAPKRIPKREQKAKARRRRAETHKIDMYKSFQGSVLMAIGMLVQEQVAHLLRRPAPVNWERGLQEAKAQDPDPSDGEETSMGESFGDESTGIHERQADEAATPPRSSALQPGHTIETSLDDAEGISGDERGGGIEDG